MKIITKITLTTLLMVLLGHINLSAQVVASYADRSYLITFDPGTTQAEITQTMIDLQSDEIWVSPLTGTRKWEMSANVQFPYYNQALGVNILDINEQREGAAGRAKVNETELNYFYQIDPLATNPPSSAQNYCYTEMPRYRERSDLKVAILDTGFNGSSYGVTPVSKKNYVDGGTSVEDLNGHGTHIFSVIEDTYKQNTNLHPNTVSWDIRKTHDDDGYAELANIILALEEAVVDGAQIINMSTSYYDEEDGELQDLVNNVIDVIEQNNVLIVTSAGNESSSIDHVNGPVSFPSKFTTYNLLTVGAFDCEEDVLADYSNYGQYSVDIAAPGTKILGYEDRTFTPTYKSGTSQATAIVSGVAVALGKFQTTFDYQEVKCAILRGADYKPDLEGKVLTFGYLNAKQALRELKFGCTDIIDTPGHNVYGEGGGRSVMEDNYSEVIYPNPAREMITLKFDNIQENIGVKILDLRGHVISKSNHTNTNSVDLSIHDLPKGMYLMQYNTPQITNQKTFVKE